MWLPSAVAEERGQKMIIKKRCPVCNKISVVAKQTTIGKLLIINYECGHVRSVAVAAATAAAVDAVASTTSIDGKKPFKYQLEGAAWAIKNNARVLFADEMGVGKTLQSS